VDMTSDNVCPWCYIGKRRLERAISQLDPKVVRVDIALHPFFLDSSLPSPSIDKSDYYRNKFGEDRAKVLLQRMTATGKEEGINFSYGGRIGSTLLSHRLLRHVKGIRPELSNAMVDALFRAYFEEEADIADVDTLVKLGVGVGLAEDELRVYLLGKEDEAAVQNDIINAYRKGIDGVPHFVFDDQYEVSGGEQPETFLQVFKRLGVY